MASSGYVADTFVAGEQPTTAKWNELWGNDASFNTGNGFNDGILVARHFAATQIPSSAMNLTKSTDANGWEKYDFGTFQQYYKAGSTSVSVSGNQWTSAIASSNLPVGMSSIGVNFVTSSCRCLDNAISANIGPQPSDTTILLELKNQYTSTVSNLVYWAVCITTA